ncbi:hypothetical protein, partial [Acinetobacter baumannii]
NLSCTEIFLILVSILICRLGYQMFVTG